MKKFLSFIYVFIMAVLVLSLSGCGGGSHHNYDDSSTSASKLMVITSTAFRKGESYNIYRGSDVSAINANNSRVASRYYVSADRNSSPLSLNLEFSSSVSNDLPFLITLADSDSAVFFYNPNGSGNDTTSSGVSRYGGAQQLQKYSGLKLSSSSTTSSSSINPAFIEVDTSDLVTVNLSGNGTATYSYNGVSQGNVKTNNFIWAISADQPGEYWVKDGVKYFDEDDFSITSADGLYIAHDIRYVPSTLTFSQSQTKPKATDDTEQMYVAYYSTKAEGVDAANKYIIAALPTSSGMGTPGNQATPPAGFTPSASSFSDIVSAMTHSASEAYDNPVLHITKPGTYKLTGTWNGQIWVDIDDETVTEGTKTKKDKKAQVALILGGVTVNCDVAPALVFKKVYECGPDEAEDVASDYKNVNLELFNEDTAYAGAIVVIGNGTTNTFTGTNVARLNDLDVNTDDGYTATNVGSYVKAQEKLYKLDAAFHSRMSMIIGLEDNASSGTLNINSNYEGLGSEMHLLINSGTINVTADEDGINVDEDNTSVFYMEGGNLTVSSYEGDGIDSNGYVALTGGTLRVSAGSSAQGSAGESGIDAEKDVYINGASYYWAQAGSTSYTLQNGSGTNTGGTPGTDGGNSNGNTTTRVQGVTDTINSNNSVSYNGTAVALATGDISDEERAKVIATSGNTFRLVNTVNNFAGISNANGR